MAYTQITAQVNDQTLQLTNVPKLASGGVKEIRVSFDFCSLWSGAILKTAAFYRSKNKVYHVDLADDACVAPHEVFAEEGVVYMGVFAEFDGGAIRTTEVLPLEVVQGAITTPSAPVLNIDGALSTDINNPTIMEPGPVTVSGTVYDADGSVKLLTVNGVPVEVNADGTWSTDLTVVSGQMLEIVAEATDEYGNTTTKTRYICNAVEVAITAENRANFGYTGETNENLDIHAVYYDAESGTWYSATSIGSSAFSGCSNLTSVDIPDRVTSVGKYAFRDCTALTSVDIPDGVTSIGEEAFSGCNVLTSADIPNSVTSIGGSAFKSCAALTSFTIPDGITTIPGGMFDKCTTLTSVDIPSSVTSIEAGAFRNCKALTSFAIPYGVTSIGQQVFSACSNLESVSIPSSVTSIGSSAFYYCTALTRVSIPYGVTSIGNSTFNGCAALTSVSIPSSVTSIGSSAFENCSVLTSVDIPSGVTSIGGSAFRKCTALTSVGIPDGVASIGTSTFFGCDALASIFIPSSVTSIGASALAGCGNLSHVYYAGTEEQWAAISIGDYNTNLAAVTIHYNYAG